MVSTFVELSYGPTKVLVSRWTDLWGIVSYERRTSGIRPVWLTLPAKPSSMLTYAEWLSG